VRFQAAACTGALGRNSGRPSLVHLLHNSRHLHEHACILMEEHMHMNTPRAAFETVTYLYGMCIRLTSQVTAVNIQ